MTNAKGGESNHNFGIAYDISLLDENGNLIAKGTDRRYKMAAVLGKTLGLEWGGDWTSPVDPPHYQFTNGASIADVRARREQHLNPFTQRQE